MNKAVYIIRELVRKIYLETTLGPYIVQPFYGAYIYFRFTSVDEVTRINREFLKNFGRKPNLENPKLFNEKVQWLKLNDRTPLQTKCADKYAVREYVKEKVGEQYLIPLVFDTKNLKDIKPENMPDFPIIVKTNHDSSGGSIVIDKHKTNWLVVRNKLYKSLNINYYNKYKEWQYKNIEPRIIVEKLLQHDDGSIPFDYKLHYFNGELLLIHVDLDRYDNHTRNFYDPDWNKLDIIWGHVKNGRQIEKPAKLEELKSVSKALAQDFCYTRVDLYIVKDQVYFGEITLHSASGFDEITPEGWDLKLGNILKLPYES